jgi:hypothetical protein
MPQTSGIPVSRKSRCNFQNQLLARLWLDSEVLSIAEKRMLISFCRNGFHDVEDAVINKAFSKLSHVGLRMDWQRLHYPTLTGEGKKVSYDHYHWWELLKDIDLWEAKNPNPVKPKPVADEAPRPKLVQVEHVILHQIPLRQAAADVYSVLVEYGKPIRSSDIATLLNWHPQEVSVQLQLLKGVCLIEMVPHRSLWRVTERAEHYTIAVVE